MQAFCHVNQFSQSAICCRLSSKLSRFQDSLIFSLFESFFFKVFEGFFQIRESCSITKYRYSIGYASGISVTFFLVFTSSLLLLAIVFQQYVKNLVCKECDMKYRYGLVKAIIRLILKSISIVRRCPRDKRRGSHAFPRYEYEMT